MRSIATPLLSLLLLATGFAEAAEPLTASLEVRKVQPASNGREQFTPATAVLPTDVVEYRTTYRNTTGRTLHAVVATLPIPVDYQYIAGTAGTQAQASLDGKSYAPIPLKRVIKRPNGSDEVRLIPPGEYRFLRWSLGDLPAQSAAIVAARVQLIDRPTALAAR